MRSRTEERKMKNKSRVCGLAACAALAFAASGCVSLSYTEKNEKPGKEEMLKSGLRFE
jgi:hypothetical protein